MNKFAERLKELRIENNLSIKALSIHINYIVLNFINNLL